jgi:hypothetical protein
VRVNLPDSDTLQAPYGLGKEPEREKEVLVVVKRGRSVEYVQKPGAMYTSAWTELEA